MPNIKISALPPAALPLDDPNTLFEVTVLEAGLEVSRKITLSEIAGATGLDASFLTLSANAQLPNERVLTEGTNITFVDTGPNGTLTINAGGVTFPLLAPDGSAAAPSYSWSSAPSTGIHLIATNLMGFSILGTTNWQMGGKFQSDNAAGPAMQNSTVTATVPGLLPRQQDTNTGIGSNTLDQLSLIAGGAEIARATAAFAANQFAIIQSGSSAVPELTSLADPDTGFRWPADNTTVWIGGGTRAWNFSTAKFFSQFSNGPALLNEISSDTNPTVVADHADPDTGMGSSGNDELSLIAGGVEGIRIDETAGNVFITYFGPILVPFGSGTQPGYAFDGDDDTGIFRPVDDALGITAGGVESVRYAELSSQIIQTNSNQVGLTASVTQTQAGGLALLSSYNEVATVASAGDALTAFAVTAGERLVVTNNGINNLQLFPAVGDDIGAGVDASIIIQPAETAVFIGRDATNWDTLYNGPINPSFSIPDPLLLSNGSAAAPTYSFASDIDCGMYREDTNRLGLAAGGVDAVLYQESIGGITAASQNNIGLVASVTQTQAGGLVLTSSYNEVATVATTGDALTLQGPPTLASVTAKHIVVVNNGANDLQLFPALGDDLGAGVNASITVVAGDICILLGRDGTNWDVLYNAAATPGGPGGVLPVGTISEASLKWDGVSSWIEEVQIRLTGGSTGITILDVGGTDNIRIGHDGSNALVRTTGSAEVIFGGGGAGPTTGWRFEQLIRVPDGSAAVPGITWFGDIATGFFRGGLGLSASITGVEQLRISNATTQVFSDDFRLVPNIGADSVIMRVNPPADPNDFTITLASLTDFHIIGVGLERFVLEEPNLAMVEKAAAPGDVAGVGQWWVRNDVPNIPMFTNDVGIDFKLGVANDAVQARRTTSYVLTTAFADVTLDTTDIETDDQIIEHSGTTDRIEALVAGTYEVTYGTDIDPAAAGNDNIQAFGRVRLNDAGVDLPGSLASASAYNDASTIGNNVFGRLQCSFIVVLAISDFLTLQLMKIETGGTGIFTAEEVTVTAKRLL